MGLLDDAGGRQTVPPGYDARTRPDFAKVHLPGNYLLPPSFDFHIVGTRLEILGIHSH